MITPCVLVVESDLLIRHPLAEYLRECGFRVLEAVSASEARELLAEGLYTVDVILVDIDASGEESFSLAAWVRRTRPGMEVVLAGTAATAVQKAGDLCEDGPTLNKPYDHQIVLDRIRRLIGARKRNSRNG